MHDPNHPGEPSPDHTARRAADAPGSVGAHAPRSDDFDDGDDNDDIDVIVAGGGPTGAMLAAELGLHGVAVTILEREADPPPFVRIVSLHQRTLEVMAMRGLLDRLLPHGRRRPASGLYAAIPAPGPSEARPDGPQLLGISQPTLQRMLLERAVELGAVVRRPCTVVGLDQDDRGVTVDLADGGRLRARHLVGCDGARSAVRKALGVAFPGVASTSETLMGEMEAAAPWPEIAAALAEIRGSQPRLWIRPVGEGLYSVVVPLPRGVARVHQPVLDDVARELRAIAGTDFGVHSPRWLSCFGDATRLAERYRVGRVFLAGDAAHIHPPSGGQGVNLGIQDAVNLGWKLAGQVLGWAPGSLLDTYQAERRPVAADVLDDTRAQMELASPEPGPRAVRRLLTELVQIEEVDRRLTEKIIGTAIRYDLGAGADQVGRRQPDVALAEGRLHDRMHQGRGVVIDRTGRLSSSPWGDRVDRLDAHVAEAEAPCVLVRPDGHVAWIGDDQVELDAHLSRWFGDPMTAVPRVAPPFATKGDTSCP